MRKQIILFMVTAFFMQPTLLMASDAPQAPATQQGTPRRRVECLLGLCMGGTACALVFGMLIAGWADQSTSSSHHNVTTEGVAPHTFAAHTSVFALKKKADLNALKHAFKSQRAKPITNPQPLKMRFARHNFNEAQMRNMKSQSKKQIKK